MRAMWSRATQVQSLCHCRLCHYTASTLVRRATTAASRRKATASDIFTACYTTILGTATIIDAHSKDARRKELDEKLEKAKTALDTRGIQESPLDEQQEDSYGSPSSSVKNEQRNRSAPKRSNEKTTSSLLQELASLCNITQSPSGRSSWVQDQLDWVRVEATIVAEENDPGCVLREPKSLRQLGLTTGTIVRLVDGLLEQTHIRRSSPGGHGEEDASEPLTRAEENILNELEHIRSGLYYPSYKQPTSDPAESHKVRSLLSESLRRIFNQAYSSTEAVGRICYNLLIASYPPTIHTYNALIAGFNRTQRPDLAQVVVESYIYDTAWPATQQTMVCLLNHYRGTNDIRGLRDVIARMRGVKDTGLHLSIISKADVYSEEWLAWASKRCASRKYAFVERASRGSLVFDNIIKGWLHHGNVSAASMVFVACIRNGSWISVQTLHQLFTACLAAVDHSAARQMVRGIVKNLGQFIKVIERVIRVSTAAMSLKVVDGLSKLIRICGLPLRNASEIVDEGYVRSLLRLEYLLSTSKIQLELQSSARLCSKVLDAVESAGSLISRLESAVKIVDASQWDWKAFENYETIARLLSIDKRYQDLERKGKAVSNQAKALIIKITTRLDFDPNSLLTSKRHKTWRQNHHIALNDALSPLELNSDPLTQDYIKTEFIQGIPNPQLARRFKLVGHWQNMCPKVLASFYGPNAATFDRPEDPHLRRFIRKVEEAVLDLEDFVKVILFSYLSVERQKRLRHVYREWYKMPLAPLIDYHMRRVVRGRKKTTTEIKQTTTDGYAVIDAHEEEKDVVPAGSTTQPAREEEATTTENPAPAAGAVGYYEDIAEPAAHSCLPSSRIQNKQSMWHFVAKG